MWPIWLTHHHREEGERCFWLGPLPLCRRCAAVWPACFLLLFAGLTRPLPVAGLAELALLLSPPVLEYCALALGALDYRPARTWFFGLWMGGGFGRLFHRYLLEPGDPVTWGVMAAVALPCLASVAWRLSRIRTGSR